MWLRYRLKKDTKEKVNKGQWRIRGNTLTVVGLPEAEVNEKEKVVVVVKMSYYFKRIRHVLQKYFSGSSQITVR